MAVVFHSATIDGINDFTDLGGNTVSWNGSTYLEFVGMWPDPSDTVTSDLTLSGSDWHIEAVRYHSSTDFTNISDANGNGGREISYLVLGMNSDVDLISTRIKHIDTHSGGALHDITLGSESAESVQLRAAENILTTNAGWVRSVRTEGDDTITIGSGGAGTIETGDGNDVINVNGSSVDLVRGGGSGSQHNVTLTGGAEIRTLSLHDSTNVIDLQGNSRIFFFQTSHSTNTLTTDTHWFGFLDSFNAENTISIGSGGAGTLNFGSDTSAKNQTITADGHINSVLAWGNVSVDLTLGAGGAGSVRLGDRGDTVMTGTGFVEFISTRNGHDTVTIGGGGASTVRLGDGNDQITTGTGFVAYIDAGDGHDIINLGTGGSINVRGGNGNDTVSVSEWGGGGITLYGGSGTDLLNFGNFSTGITFSLDTIDWQSPAGGGPTFLQGGFENLTGTTHDDHLTGNADNNEIRGDGGNDTILGLDGNDLLFGLAGNDDIDGGLGNDTLNGGGGHDNLEGGAGHDLLEGGGGKDTLNGGNGHDTLDGGSGNDRLLGGLGADVMNGGDNNDLLAGARGNDTLNGGSGADVFLFRSQAGTDLVEDFEDGIDLLRIAEHVGGFGSLSISVDGLDLRVEHDGGTIILEGHAGTTLTAADFDFI